MKRNVLALALLLSATSGCYTPLTAPFTDGIGFRDLIFFQDQSIATRNSNEAYKAWKRAKWDYWRQGVPYYLREHIGRGFQQGYIDVVGGGSGDLPLFAPKNYWGPGYQNPRGSEMIAAWFRGYQDGAMAGEMSGLQRYVLLPTSSAAPMPGAVHTPSDQPVETPAAPLDYLPESVPSNPPPPPVPRMEPLPLPPPPTVFPPAATEPAPLPGKQTQKSATPPKLMVTPAAAETDATDIPAVAPADGKDI
jgi:hypothetical protein